MREIKFRFWDSQKYLYDFNVRSDGYVANPSIPLQELEGKLEQYTGLKDRNDVEICEGDIVRPFINHKVLSQIVFKEGAFKIRTKVHNRFVYFTYFKDEIRLIGNIHENPELLEE